jgi:ankyrin repeat protein
MLNGMPKREIVWISFLFLAATAALIAGRHFQQKARAYELYEAMLNSDYERVRSMLDQGTNPDVLTIDRQLPLNLAVQAGDMEMVRLLLEFGADCTRKDAEGYTPLMSALKTSDTMLELLLAEGCESEIPVDIANELMIRLAFAGTPTCAAYLLDRGARADVLVADWDSTALHDAVYFGNRELVSLFLDQGANINVLDREGMTPLDQLRRYRPTKIDRALWLRKMGAKSATLSESALDSLLGISEVTDEDAPNLSADAHSRQ